MPSSPTDREYALTRLAAYSKRIDDGTEARRERDDFLRELFAAGWTQEELATALDISQQRISRIINATREKS